MAEFDWASTSVGPIEAWPDSLRFAVRTVLVSRFPTIVLWGPDLLQFYNDAYAPVIGAKHPAIGKDIRRTQPETWGALQPPIEHAMRTLEASWMPGLLLQLERYGYREETYFTVSHAPAFDDEGQGAGIHAICTEVTGELVAARRQRLLHDLATAGSRLGDEQDTVARMCRALEAGALDVPFAAVYLSMPGEAGFRRIATAGCDPHLLPAGAPRGGAGLARGGGAARGPRGALRRPGEGGRRPAPGRVAGPRTEGAAGRGHEPQPPAGRRVPVLLRARGQPVRRGSGQHPHLGGRAPPR